MEESMPENKPEADIANITRRCNNCKVEKPLIDFQPAKRCKLGRKSTCRACNNASEFRRNHSNDRRSKYSRAYYRRNKAKWAKNKEQNAERNAVRNSKYANDPEYRERQKAYAKSRYHKNTEARQRERLRTYDLTPESFNALMDKQEHKCAICGHTEKLSKVFPVIDHCHNAGTVRGVLCSLCNKGIGLLKDSPELLRRAAAYIEQYQREGSPVGNVIPNPLNEFGEPLFEVEECQVMRALFKNGDKIKDIALAYRTSEVLVAEIIEGRYPANEPYTYPSDKEFRKRLKFDEFKASSIVDYGVMVY